MHHVYKKNVKRITAFIERERESLRERERERIKEGKKNSNIGIGATRQNFRCRHPQVSSQGEIPVDLNLHW